MHLVRNDVYGTSFWRMTYVVMVYVLKDVLLFCVCQVIRYDLNRSWKYQLLC